MCLLTDISTKLQFIVTPMIGQDEIDIDALHLSNYAYRSLYFVFYQRLIIDVFYRIISLVLFSDKSWF